RGVEITFDVQASVRETTTSWFSAVFGGGAVNRLLRRFARSGAQVMGIFLPVIFGSIFTRDNPQRTSRTFFPPRIPKFYIGHFATAKLQLHTYLVTPIQKFFGVPDFR